MIQVLEEEVHLDQIQYFQQLQVQVEEVLLQYQDVLQHLEVPVPEEQVLEV